MTASPESEAAGPASHLTFRLPVSGVHRNEVAAGLCGALLNATIGFAVGPSALSSSGERIITFTATRRSFRVAEACLESMTGGPASAERAIASELLLGLRRQAEAFGLDGDV